VEVVNDRKATKKIKDATSKNKRRLKKSGGRREGRSS